MPRVMTHARGTVVAAVQRVARLPRPLLAALVAMVLVLGGSAVALAGDGEDRTVTARFSRAVQVYEGSEVRVMGVPIGEVTAVVPEGPTVRVEMVYGEEYRLPADAQAVIVTPTLTADRFVQLAPAYTGGEELPDGAEIAVEDTGTPIEIDRVYRSLVDLTGALGPDGVNQDGTLDAVLGSGAELLDGQGRKANRMLVNLSAAVETFADGSGDLFSTVRSLDQLTATFAANDRQVGRFLRELGAVAGQLGSERQELLAMLRALAGVMGKVERFVRDNREQLTTEVGKLGRVLKVLSDERVNLDIALRTGALAMGNLQNSWDGYTKNVGARLNVKGSVINMSGFLCAMVKNGSVPSAETACELFDQLLDPLQGPGSPLGDSGSLFPQARASRQPTLGGAAGRDQPERRDGGWPMTSRRLRSLAWVLALGSALSLTGCEAYDLPLPGRPVGEDDSFEITAEFRDVSTLVPRHTVKVNDVTVGEVVDVTGEGWHAVVTMRVRDDVELPGNAIADIRQTSLLGEKYVALLPPPGEEPRGRLADGAELGQARTTRTPELEEVLGALSFLLNGGGVGQLQVITSELNRAFEGRTGKVRSVLRQMRSMAQVLDEQRTDIIDAMSAVDGLSSTLNREKDVIDGALAAFPPAVRLMSQQHEQLIEMLSALDRLGKVGTRVVDASKAALIADLRHLRPVLRRLNKVGPDLPDAAGTMLSFPFPYDSDPIVKGDYANTKVIFNIDLANVVRAAGEDGGGGGGGLPDLPDLPDLPPVVPGGPGGDDGLLGGVTGLTGRPTAGDDGARRRRSARRWSGMRAGVRTRLVAFVVLSAVGVAYASASYLGLWDKVLGRGYTVTAYLPSSGGLYNGSQVTYRGVKVGEVSAMVPADKGLAVTLTMQDEARIPAESPFFVHNGSAVGEQYLDFEPRAAGEPYLRDGDEIRGGPDALPVDEADVLLELDEFVGSVDRQDLRTVVEELGLMFDGAARPLQGLVDDADTLVRAAERDTAPTVRLINNGRTVLRTQEANRSSIRTLARGLAQVSTALRTGDPQLRAILQGGPGTADQVRLLLEGLEPTLPVLTSNLATVAQVTTARVPAIEQLLNTFPVNVAGGFTGTSPDGYGSVELQFDDAPPPCTKGYLPVNRWRPPSDETDGKVYKKAHCASGPPINVRGTKHAPGPPVGWWNRGRVAPYDPRTGEVTTGRSRGAVISDPTGGDVYGSEAWKWILVGPTVLQ